MIETTPSSELRVESDDLVANLCHKSIVEKMSSESELEEFLAAAQKEEQK